MKNNSAEPKKKANKIYSNIGLKLLSVVLGFLVWLLVLNIDDSAVTRTIRDIPVNLVNTDAITSQNQLYTITSGDTVDIVVKGRKSLISDLDASDFKAVADMSKISITNAVPIMFSLVFVYFREVFLTKAEALPENCYFYHPYVLVSLSADIQNTHMVSAGLPSLFRLCCR